VRRILRLVAMAAITTLLACGGVEPSNADLELVDGGSDALPLGSPCMSNFDCASRVCFVGGNRAFCSKHCSMDTAATDCPSPPTSGTCNMQGYCRP
jgi:hypothetical protein